MSHPKVLFLCTGNSCRSQMAEGFARALRTGDFESFSAGTQPRQPDPYAIRVMQEIGIDISGRCSKGIDSLNSRFFDLTVTVCSHAHDTCPKPPAGSRILHQPFDDPPVLTASFTDDEVIMSVYRRVRNEIRDFVMKLEVLLPKPVAATVDSSSAEPCWGCADELPKSSGQVQHA
ncbi:MAG: arsenate reductase ArsC [Planctomycetota bacterium]